MVQKYVTYINKMGTELNITNWHERDEVDRSVLWGYILEGEGHCISLDSGCVQYTIGMLWLWLWDVLRPQTLSLAVLQEKVSQRNIHSSTFFTLSFEPLQTLEAVLGSRGKNNSRFYSNIWQNMECCFWYCCNLMLNIASFGKIS